MTSFTHELDRVGEDRDKEQHPIHGLALELDRLFANPPTPLQVRSFRQLLLRSERHFRAFHALARAAREVAQVAGDLGLRELAEFVLDQALVLVGAERGLLVLKEGSELSVLAARHLSEDGDPDDIKLSRSLLDRVIEDGAPLVTTNVQDDPRFAAKKSVLALSIRSVLAVPLVTPTGVIGALYLDTQITTQVFDEGDLPVVSAFAGITASAIELVGSLRSRRELFLGSVRALVNAVEAKDPYTAGHSNRVGLYAQAIARALGQNEAEAERALIGGYLHDVGKIGISDAHVTKPGSLDEREWAEFRQHTLIGERILSQTEALAPILPGVRWHHERLDGTGYPDGLAGEQIPLLPRMLGVADAFDAMTSDRPYRATRGREAAVAELHRGAGRQFDPAVVDAFLRALAQGLVPYLGKG